MGCECGGECDLAEGSRPGCGHPTPTAQCVAVPQNDVTGRVYDERWERRPYPAHAFDGKSYCYPCYVRVSTARVLRDAVEGLPPTPDRAQLAPVFRALLLYGPRWLHNGAVANETPPSMEDIVAAADGLSLDEILDRLAADAPSSGAKELLTRLAAHVRDRAG